MAMDPLYFILLLICNMGAFSTEEIKTILNKTQTHADVFKLCALCAYTGGRPTSFKGLGYSAFSPVENTELLYAQVPFRNKKYIVFVPTKLITLFKKLTEPTESIISYNSEIHVSAFARLYRTLFGYVLFKNGVDFRKRNAFRSIRAHFKTDLDNSAINEDDKKALLGYTCIEPTPENINRLAGAYMQTATSKVWVF